MTETDFSRRLTAATDAIDEGRRQLIGAEAALPQGAPDPDALRAELDLLRDVLVDLRLQIEALRVRAG